MSLERERRALDEEIQEVLLKHALNDAAQEKAGSAGAYFQQEPEHPPEFYAPSRKHKRRMNRILRQARALERRIQKEACRDEAKRNRLSMRRWLPRTPRWACNLAVAGAVVLCFVVVAQGTGLNLFQYAFQRFDVYSKLSLTEQAAPVSSEAAVPQTNEGWEEFYYPGVLTDGLSIGEITVNPAGCAYSADLKDETFFVRQFKGRTLEEYDMDSHSSDPVTVRDTTVRGFPAKTVSSEGEEKILFYDGQILVEVANFGGGSDLVRKFAEDLRWISTENFRLQKQWTAIYYPEYIPEGFTVIKFRVSNDTSYVILQKDDNLLNIIINKIHDGQISMSYDTEDAKISKIKINGLEGVLTEKKGRSSVIWHDNSYNFSVFAPLSARETLKIAQSLKPADPSTLEIEYDIR